MAATKPRAKKPATEMVEKPSTIEEPAEKAVTKATKKSPATANDIAVVSPVEPVEIDSKSSNKKNKASKTKVIRDSFSFPEQDYQKISQLKKTLLATGVHVKKSEILRAGLHVLTNLNLSELTLAVDQIEKVQTGRPNSSKK